MRHVGHDDGGAEGAKGPGFGRRQQSPLVQAETPSCSERWELEKISGAGSPQFRAKETLRFNVNVKKGEAKD